ncbi:MAG: DNA-3-methyladenine glycosylase I [Bacteroidota bacterium]
MCTRCAWANGHELLREYHDKEWGVPEYDSEALFQKLMLDGMQAGLSWLTILKKREALNYAFDQFEPEVLELYDEGDVQRLMQDARIIRNELKIRGVITNAQKYLEIQEEGSFSDWLWSFVDGEPIQNNYEKQAEVPTRSDRARRMSKALKKRGFKFVGPTICYAFMQAVGMVNDHVKDCFRHQEIQAMS